LEDTRKVKIRDKLIQGGNNIKNCPKFLDYLLFAEMTRLFFSELMRDTKAQGLGFSIFNEEISEGRNIIRNYFSSQLRRILINFWRKRNFFSLTLFPIQQESFTSQIKFFNKRKALFNLAKVFIEKYEKYECQSLFKELR